MQATKEKCDHDISQIACLVEVKSRSSSHNDQQEEKVAVLVDVMGRRIECPFTPTRCSHHDDDPTTTTTIHQQHRDASSSLIL